MDKEIIYIGDPMCSWCYGFAPVIQTLYAKYREKIDMRVVVGGLRVGPEHVVDEQRVTFLREHWQEVSERTGQNFSMGILDKTGWSYDTEKPCRAVVVMRHLSPDNVFTYFGAIQSNFYLNNHDPAPVATYADEAVKFDVDRAEFIALYEDPKTVDETMQDFAWSAQIGIRGFPSVLFRDGEKLSALTLGYQPLEALEAPFRAWLGLTEAETVH
ncbi:MAG: DsbA family protein [Alphaproteobacteria bacterium]|nr:DsbA family protein [Alphaproteobacteria bacterium]